MSIWADIHKRANGVQERKEDKIFKEDEKVNELNAWGSYIDSKQFEKHWIKLGGDYSIYGNPWKHREYRDMINDLWK